VKLLCRYGCGARFSPLAGAVGCPHCGGLLDPEPNLVRLKNKSARQWRDLIEARASSAKPADRSGVWRFQPWVLPELKPDEIVTLGEGNAPLVEGPALPGRARARLLVKLCGQQPTGSFKDLGMTALVSAAVAMRKRKSADVRVLVCASTGDTSAALAAYGARANIPVVVLLPAGKVSPAQLLQPLAHGAHVVEIDGDFDACMKVIQQVGARDGVLLANSKNPLRLLGQATVAYETVRDLGWRAPDVVVVPSGNLGNVGALYQGFSLLRALGVTRSMPRLIAAQVAAAAPFHAARASGYQTLTAVTARDTLATAIRIGDPVSFPRARRAVLESGGGTTSATEDEVIAGMRALDESGLLACPHTGAAMAGVLQMARAGELKKDDVVVLVSTASGLKFSESKARVTTRAPARALANEHAVVGALARVGVQV
jgi:threonine synthase